MANNLVKFYRLSSKVYNSADHTKDSNGIYFITDSHELIVGGVNYGMSTTLATQLNGAINKVEFTSPNTIKFVSIDKKTETTVTLPDATKSVAGLMSASDKTILDTLNGEVTVEGSVKKQISDAKESVIGNSSDTSESNTITGAKKYADSLNTTMGNRVSSLETKVGDTPVSSQITTAISKLDKADTAVAGQYVSKVSETDGIISVERVALPELATVGGTGKVITAVSQTKGALAATAIDLKAANVAATASTGDSTHVAVSGTTVADQISSLAQSIKTTSANAKTYSVKKLTENEVTALGDANVKEAYKLIDGGSNQVGDTIKIYKDSSLKSVALDGQTLNFTYILADGSESTVGVDVSTFLAESEFKDGLEVSNGNVSVKVDAASEGFLTVGADGVKLSGVQTAINTAANKAATEVTEDAAGHVTVTKTEGSNGQAIYTIGENDIASDTDLTAEVDRAKAAEDAIEAGVGLNATGGYVTPSGSHYLSGATNVMGAIVKLDTQAYTDATNLTNEIKARKDVTGINTDSYSADSTTNYLTDATSLMDADKKLDAQVKANATAISSLQNATDVVKKVTVNSVDATVSANKATVTIGGANIALTGYSAVTGGAIAATNTVNQAINILENQLIWHEA